MLDTIVEYIWVLPALFYVFGLLLIPYEPKKQSGFSKIFWGSLILITCGAIWNIQWIFVGLVGVMYSLYGLAVTSIVSNEQSKGGELKDNEDRYYQ